MDKLEPETLKFAGLKTKNGKPKKLPKKPQEIPHFVGLNNPFYRPVPVKEEVTGDTIVKSDQSKPKDMERAHILDVLQVEKIKCSILKDKNKSHKVPPLKIVRGNNQYQLANRSFLCSTKPVDNNENVSYDSVSYGNDKHNISVTVENRKPFKTPRKKICSVANCQFCSAEKCGKCLNCVNKSRHNKCLQQICPRLNKRFQLKAPFEHSSFFLSGPITDGNESIKVPPVVARRNTI